MKRIRLIYFTVGTILLGCAGDEAGPNRPTTTSSSGTTTGSGTTTSSGSGGPTTGSSGAGGSAGVTSGAAGATSTSTTGTAGTGSGGRGGSGGAGGSLDAGTDAPRDGATDGGSKSIGPVGGACPAMTTFPSPLPANRNAMLVRAGIGMLEGPLWIASQNALFFCEFTSTPTSGRIHKYTPADGNIVTFVDNVGVAGLSLDPNGQIIAASQDKQRLTRFDPVSGARSDVTGGSMYMGSPFNQVNDVVVRSDGNMYFTDPDYSRAGRPGQNALAFYRLSPQGVVTRLGTGNEPNGIALSPDGSWLYVAGSDPAKKLALAADGSAMGAPMPFYSAGSDGMAVDCAGNVYMTTMGGIVVVSPAGQNIGTITGVTDGDTTNSAFGGTDRQTLYITTSTSLYQIHLNVPGFPD
jgi:gluconolactonase